MAAHAASALHVPQAEQSVLMGCVSYDAAVGDIWNGMKRFLVAAGVPFDFVLFTNYEQQVRCLRDGLVDIAWNGPIAHVLSERECAGGVLSLGMRDVDRDFESVLAVTVRGGVRSVAELDGRELLAGARDSPQAHVVPLAHLRSLGVRPQVRSFDLDLGKHGDTALGEVAALEELASGRGSAVGAALSRMMWDRALGGKLPSVDPVALTRHCALLDSSGLPRFDHCQFDALRSADPFKLRDFQSALLSMSFEDAEQQRLMCLEGIRKEWLGPRQEGYDVMRRAVFGGARVRRASDLVPLPQQMQQQQQQRRGFSSSSGAGRAAAPGAGAAPRRPKTVCVVGGGVAGLQAVRSLRARGMEVTCYESRARVGGVWQDNYASYGVQVPRELYEFPDLPFSEASHFPDGAEVQRYIERYVAHFGLERDIKVDHRVEATQQLGDGSWEVRTNHGAGRFDYLVMATGLYCGLSRALPPSFEGARGSRAVQALHSDDFRDSSAVKGRRVVVVGGAKSGVDCAVEASKRGAAQVTLLQRHAHWPTPRKIAGVLPFQYVFLSRFGQALVSTHRGPLPYAGGTIKAARAALWPVVAPAFSVVEAIFALQLGLRGDRRPHSDVVDDFYGYGHVLDSQLNSLRKQGRVAVRRGEIDRVEHDSPSLRLKDGSAIDADMVIYATGFKSDYSMLPHSVAAKLDQAEDGLWLYRYIVPPRVQNLAFIGKVAAISNISAYGVQAEWLARHLANGTMPDTQTMEQEVEARKQWARSWMPATPARASLVLLHQIQYYDRMMQDMGEKTARKGNPLAEYLMPYLSRDYDGIVTK